MSEGPLVSLVVPGQPRGQGRPRFYRRGRGVGTYKPQEDADYAEAIAYQWREAGAVHLDGALELTVDAVFARPKGHWRTNGGLNAQGRRKPDHLQKPDLDNIVKSVKDGLNGLAYDDDAQIISIGARKRWSSDRDTHEGFLVVYLIPRREENA